MKRIFYMSSLVVALFLTACGGGDDEPSDPCAKAINVEIETTRSSADSGTGRVTITVTGGNGGFMYSLNQGTAQSSNSYTSLEVGSYTLLVEDSEGCTQTVSFNIEEVLNPSFATDISPIIQANCSTAGCHVVGGAAPFTLNGYNEISARAARIKFRTEARTMPPVGSGSLSQLQIDLIAAWVDAGAQDN